MGCTVAGTGKALPELVVTNDDLSQVVETNDEWITERTGIRNRHVALEETSTDLAADAGRAALADADMAPEDVDLLICMTITPDAVVPSQACLVKARLGLERAVAFDLNAACAGCVYGIDVAADMMEASALADLPEAAGLRLARGNRIRRALVIGVDRLSRITDWTDRSTCVLFGDGAGAVVLEWNAEAPGILSSFLENTDDPTLALACDQLRDLSTFPFGTIGQEKAGAIMSASVEEVAEELSHPHHPFISMQGQKIFKWASKAMADAVRAACERADVPLADVALIVPHQANERIIRFAAKKLGLPTDRFQVSIQDVGNTSASSVLMALADAYQTGRVRPGDKVVLVGFGGGLTLGAILFQA